LKIDLTNAKSIINKLYNSGNLTDNKPLQEENACLKKKIREMEDYQLKEID